MSTVTIGRTLDPSGEPIPGTGLDIDADGPTAERLRERTGPLMSNPVTGEWVAGLVTPEETNGEYTVGLGLFSPGNAGPPAHVHVYYEESFHVVEGEFLIVQNGVEHRVSAGDTHAVPPGAEHTFRSVGDAAGAVAVTSTPPSKVRDVISTLFGMAHEGKLNDRGQPGFLQGMVSAAATIDDTVFTSPPPAITRPLARAVAPIARALGYQAVHDRYASEAFWREHVEQPAL
ncbi:MAG: cupin domain-containing protein [Salinigranum sp.]